MSAPAVFDFEQQTVRVIDRDGEPWFVGKDVCRCLEIANHNDALGRLDADEKEGVGITDPLGKNQQTMILVSEPGVFQLIFTSRTEAARRFKRWLAHEVLPALRRDGRYEMRAPDDDGMDGFAAKVEADPEQAKVWLQLVRECTRIHGRTAARRLWARTPLPKISAEGLDVPDTVSEWLRRRVTPADGAEVQAAVLYDDYSAFCETEGAPPVSQTRFGRLLTALGIGKRQNGAVYYQGLALAA